MRIVFDNSPLYYNAILREETVIVPAGTTLQAGTVLGEVSTSGKLKQFKKGNSDGSEVPVAILNKTLVNEDTESPQEFTASVIVQGVVNENKVILNEDETLDDIVYFETVSQYKGKARTLLKNNGIIVVESQELTQEV